MAGLLTCYACYVF